MSDLVSVIIPVYKVEKYLVRCIESIIVQTYDNIEIILIDDGSPDRCPLICDEYKERDRRIRVIHKKNGGLSSARNAGIDIMKGSWVVFVDSDDFLPEYAIKEWMSTAKKLGVDLVVGNYIMYQGGNIQKKSDEGDYKIISSEELLCKMFIEDSILCTAWGKLYSSAFFTTLRYPEDVFFGEDMYMTHKIFRMAKKIAFGKNVTYLYSQEGESLVRSNYNKEKLKRIDAAKEWKEFTKVYYPNIYDEACSYYWKVINDEYLVIYGLRRRDLKCSLNVLKEEVKNYRDQIYKNSKICFKYKMLTWMIIHDLTWIYTFVSKIIHKIEGIDL